MLFSSRCRGLYTFSSVVFTSHNVCRSTWQKITCFFSSKTAETPDEMLRVCVDRCTAAFSNSSRDAGACGCGVKHVKAHVSVSLIVRCQTCACVRTFAWGAGVLSPARVHVLRVDRVEAHAPPDNRCPACAPAHIHWTSAPQVAGTRTREGRESPTNCSFDKKKSSCTQQMVRGEWVSDKHGRCTLLTRALQEKGGSGRLLEWPKTASIIYNG